MARTDLRRPGGSRRASLRGFALECIEYGLEHGSIPGVDHARVPAAWRDPAACFVTLQLDGALRGCIGTFDAERALVDNVATSAFRSAFEDPRFPPATAPELRRLEVEISVLSRPGPFVVGSREELLDRLEPGVDGLIVSEGLHRATFLPAVWESLPEPGAFVDALFRKAGLSPGHWSGTLRFERYTATKAD